MTVSRLLSHWQAVRAGLLETLAKFRDDELDFRPYAASWTVRELMLHIAQEERGEFAYGIIQILREFPPEYPAQDFPTLETIKALLEIVHADSLTYFTALSDADLDRIVETPWGAHYPLFDMVEHMIDHEIHHRGELSLMLGLLGREGLNA